jgi:hypothetical protein
MKELQKLPSDMPTGQSVKSSAESEKTLRAARLRGATAPLRSKRDSGRKELSSFGKGSRSSHSRARRSRQASPKVHESRLNSVMESRIHVQKLFGQIDHLYGKIDKAFGGQPFLPDLPAHAPENRRRATVYLQQFERVTRLLYRALDLWRIACGSEMMDTHISLWETRRGP